MSKQRGFTLVEIVIVIAIIGILAAVTVVALKPQEIFANGRNSRRTSDVAAINSAIGQWLAREGAGLAEADAYDAIGLTPLVAITPGDGVAQTEGEAASVLSVLVTTGYLQSIPLDPDGSTTYRVGVNDVLNPQHVLVCTGVIEDTSTYPWDPTYPNGVFCQSN
jgi:prepilin-type N-terminal cleavage/methylation domain-containing protein